MFLLCASHWSVVPWRGELQQVQARLSWQTDLTVIRPDVRPHSRRVPLLLEYDHVQPFLLHIRELPRWSLGIEVHGLVQYVHVLAGVVLANSPDLNYHPECPRTYPPVICL